MNDSGSPILTRLEADRAQREKDKLLPPITAEEAYVIQKARPLTNSDLNRMTEEEQAKLIRIMKTI